MSDEGRDYVKQYSPYSGTTFWLHYVLGDIANAQHDYEIFVTDARLMKEWPFSERALVRGRSELARDGFVERLSRSVPRQRARYRFVFKDVPKNARQIGARLTHAKSAPITRQIGADPTPKPRSSPLTNRSGTEGTSATSSPGGSSVTLTARSILGPFWTNLSKRPAARYAEVLTLIEDRLDAGYSPEAIRSALPTMSAFSRNAFDLALRQPVATGGQRRNADVIGEVLSALVPSHSLELVP